MNNTRQVLHALLLLLATPAGFAAQDNLLEAGTRRQDNVLEQQTKPLPSAAEPAAHSPAPSAAKPSAPVQALPAERFYSAGQRAEPRLWALLNNGRYPELNREIERLRAEDPRWQPPAELIHWLRHHLAQARKPATAHPRAAHPAPSVIPPRPPLKKTAPPPDLNARYGAAVTHAAHLDRSGQTAAALEHLEPWERQILTRQDGGVLELLAWLRFKTGQYPAARADFRQALRWRPTASAAEGELLTLEKLARDDELATAAQGHVARWPELSKTAANALRTAAANQNRQGAYRAASELLAKAARLQPADRGVRLLTAWNDFQQQHWRTAADQFAELYQQEQDEDSAQGLYLSLSKLDATAELAERAKESGPLQALWQGRQAELAYEAKHFLAAYAAHPDRYPALAHIDSDRLSGAIAHRWRSGAAGMGRLREWSVPVAGYEYRQGTFSGHLTIHHTRLDSDALPAGQPVGTAPEHPPLAYPFAPTTELTGGWSGELILRQEGEWSPWLRLGTTPAGAALPPDRYGAAGLAHRAADHYWEISAHALPVRESQLSWTGIRDPYQGDAWGQVSRRGLTVQGWQTLAPDWTASGTVRASVYRGQDVADNQGLYLSFGLGRELGLDGFDYFTVGPVVDYTRFSKNLSHFTRGQGGYYSPQRDAGLALAVNFQSGEGQQWLLRGQGHLGVRHQYEAASPWQPLAQDGRFFAATRNTGFGVGGALQGIWRLAPHWQLGAAIAFDRSPTFQQGSGYVVLRYLFEPRPAVFSSDLPEATGFD